ncbi:histidine kinase [Spirosoma sp. BT702]|uniref:Histidine kinase n=1 Tax=Spirosoma profusum TaxID=2771354 RepID=A0A926Y1P5_9BACT|nr:histidine kinase [Spirosoma profusum]MBD2704461.1 histidine kinase [Spirosoma profusum]
MRTLILLALLLNVSVAFGQEKPVELPAELPGGSLDIGRYVSFYEDASTDTLPAKAILTKPFQPFLLRPTNRLSTRGPVMKWLRFTLQNTDLHKPVNLWLHVGRHSLIRLYSVDSLKNTNLLTVAGGSIPADGIASDAPGRMVVRIALAPNQQQTFLLSVATFQSPDPIQTTLYTLPFYKSFLNDFHQRQLPVLAFYIGLIACLLFMGLFATAQYVTNRDVIYVWYSLYILTTCFNFLRVPETQFQLDWWLPNHPTVRLTLLPIIQLATQFFYLLFFGTLLELPRYQPRLWQWYRSFLACLTVLFGLSLGSLLIGGGGSLLLIYFSRPSGLLVMMTLVAIIILAGLALRGKHALRSYAFVGLVFIAIGAIAMLLLNRMNLSRTSIFLQMPSIFLGGATLLEVFCFSLALGKRTYLVEKEKKQLQQRHTEELETQLALRTKEVQEQSRQLEVQHIRQLETEFEQKLADTEMTALRAQMNPHFIFNCLNSIKLYTLDNEAEKASDYLTKFARLIRLVLENSRSEYVTLQNELEALQLYIELEAMRFKHKLQFSIQVDPAIDQRFIRIPPLLLQPYVENAIWHGLMHKPEGGTVSVDVTQPQESLLHIEITDDGVGRQQASELKSKSAGKYKSFGMQVTADRIRMINQLYNTQAQAQIVDLVDSFGEPGGTQVILKIPV